MAEVSRDTKLTTIAAHAVASLHAWKKGKGKGGVGGVGSSNEDVDNSSGIVASETVDSNSEHFLEKNRSPQLNGVNIINGLKRSVIDDTGSTVLSSKRLKAFEDDDNSNDSALCGISSESTNSHIKTVPGKVDQSDHSNTAKEHETPTEQNDSSIGDITKSNVPLLNSCKQGHENIEFDDIESQESMGLSSNQSIQCSDLSDESREASSKEEDYKDADINSSTVTKKQVVGLRDLEADQISEIKIDQSIEDTSGENIHMNSDEHNESNCSSLVSSEEIETDDKGETNVSNLEQNDTDEELIKEAERLVELERSTNAVDLNNDVGESNVANQESNNVSINAGDAKLNNGLLTDNCNEVETKRGLPVVDCMESDASGVDEHQPIIKENGEVSLDGDAWKTDATLPAEEKQRATTAADECSFEAELAVSSSLPHGSSSKEKLDNVRELLCNMVSELERPQTPYCTPPQSDNETSAVQSQPAAESCDEISIVNVKVTSLGRSPVTSMKPLDEDAASEASVELRDSEEEKILLPVDVLGCSPDKVIAALFKSTAREIVKRKNKENDHLFTKMSDLISQKMSQLITLGDKLDQQVERKAQRRHVCQQTPYYLLHAGIAAVSGSGGSVGAVVPGAAVGPRNLPPQGHQRSPAKNSDPQPRHIAGFSPHHTLRGVRQQNALNQQQAFTPVVNQLQTPGSLGRPPTVAPSHQLVGLGKMASTSATAVSQGQGFVLINSAATPTGGSVGSSGLQPVPVTLQHQPHGVQHQLGQQQPTRIQQPPSIFQQRLAQQRVQQAQLARQQQEQRRRQVQNQTFQPRQQYGRQQQQPQPQQPHQQHPQPQQSHQQQPQRVPAPQRVVQPASSQFLKQTPPGQPSGGGSTRLRRPSLSAGGGPSGGGPSPPKRPSTGTGACEVIDLSDEEEEIEIITETKTRLPLQPPASHASHASHASRIVIPPGVAAPTPYPATRRPLPGRMASQTGVRSIAPRQDLGTTSTSLVRCPVPLPVLADLRSRGGAPPPPGLLPPAPMVKADLRPRGIFISWRLRTKADEERIKASPVSKFLVYALNIPEAALSEATGATPSAAAASVVAASRPGSIAWRHVGDVEAMALPMGCTLTKFEAGRYFFAVAAKDTFNRYGPFSEVESLVMPAHICQKINSLNNGSS